MIRIQLGSDFGQQRPSYEVDITKPLATQIPLGRIIVINNFGQRLSYEVDFAKPLAAQIPPPSEPQPGFVIKVVTQQGDEVFCEVDPRAPLVPQLRSKTGITSGDERWLFDGLLIRRHATAEQLKIVPGDVVDCVGPSIYD
jgi:hypothetical protein